MRKETGSEIARILRLAWPAILQEALSTVVTYVDTAMIGVLGAHSSASVGLTQTIGWLVGSIPGAFGIGVLAVCAQADGAGDEDTLKKAGQQALYLTLGIGLVLTAACMAVSPYVAAWLGGDPSIREDATIYFRITMLPLLFRIMMIILSGALRGVSDMKTPMLMQLLMNVANMVLNFILIYPTRTIWGIRVYGADMGVKGAAVATAVATVLGGAAILIRFLRNSRFDFRHTGFRLDKRVMLRILDIGIPACVKRALICFGHIAFSSMIARLGVIPFAAHTIAIQAEQAFYIPGYGLQSAAATLAGNAIGEGNENRLRHMTRTICSMAFALMTVAGTVLFLFAPNLMRIFTPDEEVVRLGASVLRIVAVSEPIYGVLVNLEGIFDGMGDTRAPVLYAIITIWGIRILGTWLMIHVFHQGLQAVWVMMIADNIGRCLLLLTRFLLRHGGKVHPRQA